MRQDSQVWSMLAPAYARMCRASCLCRASYVSYSMCMSSSMSVVFLVCHAPCASYFMCVHHAPRVSCFMSVSCSSSCSPYACMLHGYTGSVCACALSSFFCSVVMARGIARVTKNGVRCVSMRASFTLSSAPPISFVVRPMSFRE